MSVFEAYLTLQMDAWRGAVICVGFGCGASAFCFSLQNKRLLAIVFAAIMFLSGLLFLVLPSSDNISILRSLQRYNSASQEVSGQASYPLARGDNALPPNYP